VRLLVQRRGARSRAAGVPCRGHFLTQKSGRQGCGSRPRRRLVLSDTSL